MRMRNIIGAMGWISTTGRGVQFHDAQIGCYKERRHVSRKVEQHVTQQRQAQFAPHVQTVAALGWHLALALAGVPEPALIPMRG